MRVITRGVKLEKTNASELDGDTTLTQRIRVTRTLVFEGPAKWVNDTLDRSWVGPERPISLGGGQSVTELPRFREEL